MRTNLVLLALGGALVVGPAALADVVIDLGGGWQATIFDEEDIGLAVDFVSLDENILVIQKFANFDSIDPLTGLPDPARIMFNQIADDAHTVSRIVFADQIITNNTGMHWTSFQEVLMGGVATFDPVASADFDVDPFTTTEYSNGDSIVTFSGGTVFDGDVWTPGLGNGGDGGALYINIDLSGDAAKFVVKEIAIPAPGALALLGVAGLAGRRRRRG